jgi:hypothetical protein
MENKLFKKIFFLYPTLQRNSTENLKQIFPEKELRVHIPNVSVSYLYIRRIDLPILLQEIQYVDRS